MKKLMIVAVTAMLGIAAHAGAAYWSVENVYDYAAGGSSTLNNGYTAYLFNSADIEAGSFLAAFIADAAGTLDMGVEGADLISGGMTEQEGGSYTGGRDLNAYVVVFNNGTAANADHIYITADQTVYVPGGGATANFDNPFNAAGSATGSSWTAVAPEPTSGLLLLIGMAGLSLRRRRA